MIYQEKMRQIAVLGAGGKMGSGIVLLLAQELFDVQHGVSDKKDDFCLYAIDTSEQQLNGLHNYLQTQLLKAAEKKCVYLRGIYRDRKDLIDNQQVIEAFVKDCMKLVRFSQRIESAFPADVVFEAASEQADLKVKLLKTIKQNSDKKAFFLTNTSSIPISYLDQEANLDGRIIGFHFYNPPAIQKLLELIYTSSNTDEMKAFAQQLAGNLNKIVIESNDIAGFIGNGHFMRDVIYAQEMAEKLAEDMPLTQAIWTMDYVSKHYLMRPMGIFQLTDYVGIDVVEHILKVMDHFILTESLKAKLSARMNHLDVLGGQFSNGKQKDGFFQYDTKGNILAVFNPETETYESIDNHLEEWMNKLDPHPINPPEWKDIIRRKDKNEIVAAFYEEMKTQKDSFACHLALNYAREMKLIGEALVTNGVAKCEEDVNKVMLTGFFHAYGPINPYI